jgi:rSAM/selenodomain-associated transferase 1
MARRKRQALALFAQYPEAGYLRTRLTSRLGLEAATELYQAFLRDLLNNHRQQPYDVVVYLEPWECAEEFKDQFQVDRVMPQVGFSPGERLGNAVADLSEDYHRIALAGSLMPYLFPEDVTSAFRHLKAYDAVLGPSSDGTYYLLAMWRLLPIFDEIPWGTSRVLQETLRQLDLIGLSYLLLESRSDVATVTALQKAHRHLKDPRLTETRRVVQRLLVARATKA